MVIALPFAHGLLSALLQDALGRTGKPRIHLKGHIFAAIKAIADFLKSNVINLMELVPLALSDIGACYCDASCCQSRLLGGIQFDVLNPDAHLMAAWWRPAYPSSHPLQPSHLQPSTQQL